MTPSCATKPNGARNSSRPSEAPIRPSGPVRNTSIERENVPSCSISSVKTMNSISGTLAMIAVPAFDDSSAAPAIAIW